ncbi:hypothetical protein P152DRAFT_500665 [Eremomyces bilateralis CBS 781.70]|uniref:Uncharacterized protein n=1 Tax=Eremomyces bilateralis CBS 781.70 TaxID=1392243 RepID=A0A6G1G9Q0_9PEZI|nr:uncharacterized protein P152DRAFT_500665 [Eremomyces bilateralis CBS 781.70]KAF1814666.1 hypothetical protein P152DRAFT_500665 [Eremomyces bilateralis CBS 781.70]
MHPSRIDIMNYTVGFCSLHCSHRLPNTDSRNDIPVQLQVYPDVTPENTPEFCTRLYNHFACKHLRLAGIYKCGRGSGDPQHRCIEPICAIGACLEVTVCRDCLPPPGLVAIPRSDSCNLLSYCAKESPRLSTCVRPMNHLLKPFQSNKGVSFRPSQSGVPPMPSTLTTTPQPTTWQWTTSETYCGSPASIEWQSATVPLSNAVKGSHTPPSEHERSMTQMDQMQRLLDEELIPYARQVQEIQPAPTSPPSTEHSNRGRRNASSRAPARRSRGRASASLKIFSNAQAATRPPSSILSPSASCKRRTRISTGNAAMPQAPERPSRTQPSRISKSGAIVKLSSSRK